MCPPPPNPFFSPPPSYYYYYYPLVLPYPLVSLYFTIIFTSFCRRRRAITSGLQWRLKWLWRLCCWNSCMVAPRSVLMHVHILAEVFSWWRSVLWRQLYVRTYSCCRISDTGFCSRTFLSYHIHCIHKRGKGRHVNKSALYLSGFKPNIFCIIMLVTFRCAFVFVPVIILVFCIWLFFLESMGRDYS